MQDHILIDVVRYPSIDRLVVRCVLCSGQIQESDVQTVAKLFVNFRIEQLYIDNGTITKIVFMDKHDIETLWKVIGKEALYARRYGSHVLELQKSSGVLYTGQSRLTWEYYPLVAGVTISLEYESRIISTGSLIRELDALAPLSDRVEYLVCNAPGCKVLIPNLHTQYRSDIASLFT